jgi:hypothetical protein
VRHWPGSGETSFASVRPGGVQFTAPLFREDLSRHVLADEQPILERLRDALYLIRKHSNRNYTMDPFLTRPGIFGLSLVDPRSECDQRLRYEQSGRAYSMGSGFWTEPRAKVTLDNHAIDGLIMDTTFKVLNQFHTAILIAVSYTVGLPLALSFGPHDTIELDGRFYAVLLQDFQIDLGRYILESDQGAALKHGRKKHPRHLF